MVLNRHGISQYWRVLLSHGRMDGLWSWVVVCRPQVTQAAVLIGARDDAYVSPLSVEAVHCHWPGSEVWYTPGGHVSSFVLLNPLFLNAVMTSLTKLECAAQGTAERQAASTDA